MVIDEADRMFEKNHFEEFPCLLERINHPAEKLTTENRRQTFVFSATLSLSHAPPSYVLKKKRSTWISLKMKVSISIWFTTVFFVLSISDKTKQSVKISSEEKLKAFINLLELKHPSIVDITKKNGNLYKKCKWTFSQ